MVKLAMALSLYRRYDGDMSLLMREVLQSPDLLLKYTVPAGLYAVYNNLMYINLTNFDPGTYTLMMQLRILFTVLVGALSSTATLCADLADPFRGQFRVTPSYCLARAALDKKPWWPSMDTSPKALLSRG